MKARKGRPKLDDDPAVNEALWRFAEILFQISASASVDEENDSKQSQNEEEDDE